MSTVETDKTLRRATQAAYCGAVLAIAGLVGTMLLTTLLRDLWWPGLIITLLALPVAVGGLIAQQRSLDVKFTQLAVRTSGGRA